MALGPLMIDLAGTTLAPEERERLGHPLVGGVVLFSRNYEAPEQLRALTDAIHALREPPLLVAVDHEGGRVQRFRAGFTTLPPVRRLGGIYDTHRKRAKRLAELTGWLMAIELRAVGVDFSFAPVLDLGVGVSEVIGDRAFHADPEAVADLAHSYMSGMARAGMAAVGKHFPGHGSVRADSHVEAPVDERAFEDIAVLDMLPFERMVHYGVPALMASHVVYAHVDRRPAGYSRFWLQRVLRGQLGFQGAIFSDDLSMAAASEPGDLPARVEAALAAGCDMVLACNSAASVDRALDTVRAARSAASLVRFARMHGARAVDRGRLVDDPAWREAVRAVRSYGAT